MPEARTQDLRTLQKTIGLNIRRLRTNRRLPLTKLSRQTGISVKRLDYYELGKYQMELEALYRLAVALEVDVRDLFSGKQT